MPATTVSTLADLVDQQYQLWRVCPNGCPDAQVDLPRLTLRYGRDASYIRGKTPIRIKCARCGASCPDGFIIPKPGPGL